MKYRCLITILALILMFIPGQTTSEMSSTNYRITTTVVSGGGGPMGSASFQTNGTLGQPTPLPDPADPPFSDAYDLYPGFWYTVANIGLTFPGDFNGDRDVDGEDLVNYLIDDDGLQLWEFARNFGKVNCP